MNAGPKKPSLLKYKNAMIPHLLPMKAKELGITARQKEQWRNLSKSIRKEVETRHATATADELWADMSYKRYNQRRKEIANSRKAAAKPSSQTLQLLYQRKQKYLQQHPVLSPRSVIADNYLESNQILAEMRDASANTVAWVESRRLEQLQKVSNLEKHYANAISQTGYEVILKMPFKVDQRIYYCGLYLPALKCAIDISDVLASAAEKSAAKTRDLHYIGIVRLHYSKQDASKPENLHNLIEYLTK